MTPATIDATIPQGKFGKIKTGDDDIGGQLLPILSKGLYTNPLDCIRAERRGCWRPEGHYKDYR